MSASAIDREREHMAGRYYVREHIPTPAGPLTVETRAAHSHLEASVYLKVEAAGEKIQENRIIDGFEPVERED